MDSREIDKKIATEVMGWSLARINWNPSTNTAHAFEVVEKILSEKHDDFTWEFDLSIFEGMSDATFGKHYNRGKGKDVTWDAQNKETAMAICLAALEAVKEG